MPICPPCLDAASGGDYGPIPVCSVCGVGPVSVYNDAKPLAKQSVVFHKRDVLVTADRNGVEVKYLTRERCPGAAKPPREQTGHDFCHGCPCQHRPPGSWNQRERH